MRQMRQAGTINLHLESTPRSQSAQHVNFTLFHSVPPGTGTQLSTCVAWRWPQVSLQSEGVSGRGGGGVGHALVALTYIPEVAGTRWHRWLLLPRPRSRASLQCAHPWKPSTSIDRAEHFSTNGTKPK